MLPDIDNWYTFRNTLVVNFSNGVSAIFTLLLLLIVLIISIINRSVNSSVSYRLSILILISDLFFSLTNMASVQAENSLACAICTWGFLFTTLCTLLYTVAIAVNLFTMVLFNYQPNKLLNIIYHFLPLILSITISISPIIAGQISLEDESCWFKEDQIDGLMWAYGTNYGWIIATIIICGVVFITITVFLILKSRELSESYQGMDNQTQIKRKTILRLMMFPFIPIFCYIFVITKLVIAGFQIELSKEAMINLDITANFFKGFQGFLNSTLFMFNTIIYSEARKAFKSYN